MNRIIITLLIALPLLVAAQDYKSDLVNATRQLALLHNYSMHIHYRLFLDGKISKPFQESTVEVIRKEKKLYYKEGNNVEFMDNELYEISVNDGQKFMVVRAKNKLENKLAESKKQQILSMLNESIKLQLKLYSGVKVIKSDAIRTTYELQYKQGMEMESLVITVNRQTHLVEQILYNYREPVEIRELNNTRHKVTIQVSYEDLKHNVVNNDSRFSEKKYLRFYKGKIYTAQAYADYKLTFLN